MITAVADVRDARLDDFRSLTDADVRPDRRGVVIAEGVNVVQRLLTSSFTARAVVGVDARIAALADHLADVPAFVLDKWALSELVGFRVTRGVLASADRGSPRDAEQLLVAATRVAVAEGLNDFENLGALFRNAAAFGIDAVVLDERCADPLYRRSVRVSMGYALRVPFAVAASPIAVARAAGLTTLALTPHAPAVALGTLEPPARWAVALGAEGPGLTAATLAAADVAVRIPMAAGVDSLNVATAAAVTFAHLTAHLT